MQTTPSDFGALQCEYALRSISETLFIIVRDYRKHLLQGGTPEQYSALFKERMEKQDGGNRGRCPDEGR
jgi:hypothetical protein